jgi:hypothetical protein
MTCRDQIEWDGKSSQSLFVATDGLITISRGLGNTQIVEIWIGLKLKDLMCKSKHSFGKYVSSTYFLPGLIKVLQINH